MAHKIATHADGVELLQWKALPSTNDRPLHEQKKIPDTVVFCDPDTELLALKRAISKANLRMCSGSSLWSSHSSIHCDVTSLVAPQSLRSTITAVLCFHFCRFRRTSSLRVGPSKAGPSRLDARPDQTSVRLRLFEFRMNETGHY